MICFASKNFLIYFLALFLYAFPLLGEEKIDYIVKFEGVQEKQLSERLRDASDLIKLKKYLPKTERSLRRRAQKDLPRLMRVLLNRGYYNAKISVIIEMRAVSAHVIFHIDLGPVYPITEIRVEPPLDGIHLSFINKPATTINIRQCEMQILHRLAEIGYPLASIEKRNAIVDQKEKTVRLQFDVNHGPKSCFGQPCISGLKSIKKAFIIDKLGWEYGEIYDQKKIATTLHNLEASGLFNAINITCNPSTAAEGCLPISIDVSEAKMRSIGFGFGYSTQRGPGFTAEWQHRNYKGMGERLTLGINALADTQEASISYVIPDFFRLKQDLIYALEWNHDLTKGCEKKSFAVSETLERWLSERTLVSVGAVYERLKSSSNKESEKDDTGWYNLIRLPLKWRWSNVDDFMDPTRGMLFFFKLTPTFQVFGNSFLYTKTTFNSSFYKSLSKEDQSILAGKIYLGSIWGTSYKSIPDSERLNAGSDNLLRGYKYHTVSKINSDGDPMGGQSIIVYSAEFRRKIDEEWGAVFFYDAGNVFSDPVPKFRRKLLHSTGFGIRYYTPVGPLRLDIAFPIDRRRKRDEKEEKSHYIDNPYEIYFSVGQSF